MNLRSKFAALFRKEKLDREMAEEMRFHLEQRTADHIEDGLSGGRGALRRAAKIRGVEQIKERARDQRGFEACRR